MRRQGPIGARVAAALVAVSALSLLGYLVLSAYAPDLRANISDRNDALSKSAIGFAGLRVLAQSSGIQTSVGRSHPPLDRFGLVVLTPDVFPDTKKLRLLSGPGPRLIILPKWIVLPDPEHAGWVTKVSALNSVTVARSIGSVIPGAAIQQWRKPATVRLQARFPEFNAAVPNGPIRIDSLQTISGPQVVPLIIDGKGNAVVANFRGTRIFVAADPDVFNNSGLRDLSTARAAVALLNRLRAGRRPISFDVSLNGFGESPNLLRAVFSPPILGATLCVLLAAAMIALHALNRFGSVREPDRVYALGKRALADNTAAVIHLMHREPAMAPRYAETMRRLVTDHLGGPRGHDEQWLATVERRANTGHRFVALRAEADSVSDSAGLVRVAGKLHQWSKGLLHERT